MNEENNSGQFFPTRFSLGSDVFWVSSVALVYFATARFSLSLLFQPEGIAAIWPPAGIFLSAILLTKRSVRPFLVAALFVTDLIVELLAGTQFLVGAIYALTHAGGAVLSSWLLFRFSGEPIRFREVREVFGFLILAVILSNASMSLMAAAASELVPGTSSFWNSWRLWAVSNGMGNLLVTPFILSWASWANVRLVTWNLKRAFESAVLFIALALLNFFAFSYLSKSALLSLFLPYLTFPFLMWAALRFGMPGVTSVLVILTAITIPFAAGGRVPFFSLNGSPLDTLIVVQLYLAAMAIPSLFLAAVVTERWRAEGAQRKSKEDAKRLAQENELIAEIGRIISSTLNIEEVYERFAEKVRTIIPFNRIAVNCVNMKDYTRSIRYAAGDRIGGGRTGAVYPLAGSGTEEIMRTKSVLLINSKNIEELRRKFPRMSLIRSGVQSAMYIPLISKDEVIGALIFQSFNPAAYSENNMALAERVGNQIAGAVANAQLFLERRQVEEALRESEEEARQLAQKNAIIAEIGRIISSTLNLNEVFERFAKEVRKLIQFDRVSATTINPHEHTFTNIYASGIDVAERRQGSVIPLTGKSSTELMLRRRAGLIIQATTEKEVAELYPDFSNVFRAGMQSKMSVPLISKDEVIGVLHFRSRIANAYTKRDLMLAETIAGQIAGAVANAQLFLERKQMETERMNIEERLHRAEKMEALGTLAGGVAHDLNNVLGVLTGYAELLQLEIPEGNRLRNYVGKILASSEKGASIINDLLTLARRGVAVSEVVDLNRIVSAFLRTPVYEKLQAYHPQVTFRTDLSDEILNIKGSPLHLEKTVMNLISNAAEAISGNGEVVIRTEGCYLDQAIRGYDQVAEGEYVVLTVSDTGRGIPADDLPKIFEPFYTKKTMGRSGTGLGLAVVWGTVKDHNGYIDVQSEEGKGSTFTLYFPTTREQAGRDVKKIPMEQYLGKGETILVVDDVRDQREMATGMLTRLGYKVHAVSSGEEAVEYLKTNTVDLMVLDMIMDPGIDGLETYRRVLEINPKQKAIIVSGFSETDRTKDARRLGAGAYVRKPYLLEKIGIAIRDELSR
ncbi:MAG: MASE1 domain-containing protein [Deltaproteobacteria bacterium]|nr:MASE1 domain-containing protein [Deltaproteobacteria bacterium]